MRASKKDCTIHKRISQYITIGHYFHGHEANKQNHFPCVIWSVMFPLGQSVVDHQRILQHLMVYPQEKMESSVEKRCKEKRFQRRRVSKYRLINFYRSLKIIWYLFINCVAYILARPLGHLHQNFKNAFNHISKNVVIHWRYSLRRNESQPTVRTYVLQTSSLVRSVDNINKYRHI